MSSNSSAFSGGTDALRRAQRVIEKLRQRDPDHVYAAVSGGDDSIATLHYVLNSDLIELDGVVHLDTGIGIPRVREFVTEVCNAWDLDLTVVDNQTARFDHERYEQLIRVHGFPGSHPIAHKQMFMNLKNKPIDRFCNNLDGKPALISGVRKHESDRRMETIEDDPFTDDGNKLWVAPLIEFTDDDLQAYRDAHDVPQSDVAALLCASGECLCGCYSDRRDLPMIEQFFPEAARQIYRLEWEALELAARGEINDDYILWAHGSVDGGQYEARTSADQTVLCTDCEDACPATPYERSGDPLSPAEQWLAEHDLSEYWNWPFYCVPCDAVVTDPYSHRHDVHPDFRSDPDPDDIQTQWDLRLIDLGHMPAWSDRLVTEPNGWNVHPNWITTDPDQAATEKHAVHYEAVSLTPCDPGDHEWVHHDGAATAVCAECDAYDVRGCLDDPGAIDPSPTTSPDVTWETPTDAEQAQLSNLSLK